MRQGARVAVTADKQQQPARGDIDDVRSQFATVPLFDQNLNEELVALERRQQQRQQQPVPLGGSGEPIGAWAANMGSRFMPIQYNRGPTDRSHSELSVELSEPSQVASPFLSTGDTSVVPAATHGYLHDATGRATFSLPPKITRPWSVEMLMRRGEALHASLRHSQFNGSAAVPQRMNGLGSSRHGASTKQPSPARQHQHHHNRGGSTRRHRPHADPTHGGSLRDISPNAAGPSSSDDEFHHPPAPPLSYVLDPPPGLITHHANGNARDSLLLHHTNAALKMDENGDIPLLEVNDEKMEEHIERAATRKRLQEDRLKTMGIALPYSVTSDGDQTDQAVTRLAVDTHGVVKPKRQEDFSVAQLLARMGGGGGGGPAAASSPTTKEFSIQTSPLQQKRGDMSTARKSYRPEELVLDATGYRPFVAPTEAAAGDTVWRHMLVEEKNGGKRAPDQPSAYQLARYSTAGTTPARGTNINSSSNPPRELAVPSDLSAVMSSQIGLVSPFETKERIMRELDRMQLASEEMLVRNKVVDVNRDKHDPHAHRAFADVSAAHHLVVPPPLPAPDGGYRSLTDADRPAAQREEEASRWERAMHNQQQIEPVAKDGSVLTAQQRQLRRWAADKSNEVPSVVARSSIPPPVKGLTQQSSNFVYAPPAGTAGYDARRKWAGVSFNTSAIESSTRIPDLSQLSNTASSWMSLPVE